jgi:hypothetical protein
LVIEFFKRFSEISISFFYFLKICKEKLSSVDELVIIDFDSIKDGTLPLAVIIPKASQEYQSFW